MKLQKREKKLLNLLLEQTGYQAAAYFTEELGVSSKTIYKDIEKIKSMLGEFDLKIIKVPRKGIYVEGSEEKKIKAKLCIENKIESAASYTPEYRRLVLFAQLIFNDNTKSYQNYAEHFFVSVQSIKKDMDGIISFLKENNINLQDYTSNVEADIQRAFKKYLEYYQELRALLEVQQKEIFGENILMVVQKFLDGLLELGITLPNEYLLDSLKNSLLILINRLGINKHLGEEKGLLFKQLENMQLYMTALELAKHSNSELGITFKNSDVYYLCSLLLAHGIEPTLQDDYINQQIQRTINEMIRKMSMLIDCDLMQDQRLYYSLLSHIVPMIHRLQIGIDVKNPLKDQIIQQYSTMYTLVGYSITQMEKDFSIKLTNDEISFFTIHFQLAFEKVKSAKHILIVCPTGLGTAQLIYQRIKQNIPSSNVLEIIDLKKLKNTDLESVDLLISTVQLPKQKVPIRYVSALPTNEEISAINLQLSNLQASEKNFTIPMTSNTNLISSVLDKEFIFLQCNAQSQSEVINFLARKYEEKCYVSPGFRAAIYERENMGTTGLDTGVAIPHADPTTVMETKPAIVTLKNPIIWGKNKISLVILLAIAEKDMGIAKNMIASIYELLGSSKRVQKLVMSQTKNEVIQIILSEGD